MAAVLSREIRLPCELVSVTTARHFVRDTLLEWQLPRLVEDAELGVSELVANAVRHARTELTMTISVDGVATVMVSDSNPQLHRPVVRSDVLGENGRGLQIVAAIATDWGVEVVPGGKSIWFSLTLPDPQTADAELLEMGERQGAESSASHNGHTEGNARSAS